jgi:serine/threonine protein kinase
MLEFEKGKVISDRYKVRKKIGKGGMGEVYLVTDLASGEKCALKTILPQYAKDPKVVDRFIREVNAQRILDHPGIVKILGARKVEDTLFFVMEYLDGASLRALLQEAPVPIPIAFRIMYLLCQALEHAHQHTVHRDVSPDNVMLLRNADVKLLDFGLAKLTETDSDLTRTGMFLGKLHYGAPEQSADAKNVDLRADIFSLGVMLHEMLSGELPYKTRQLTDFVPELPNEVNALIDKARALEPDNRFQSAAEFRRELTRIYGIYSGKSYSESTMNGERAPDFVTDTQTSSEYLEISLSRALENAAKKKEGLKTDEQANAKTAQGRPPAGKSTVAEPKQPTFNASDDRESIEALRKELDKHTNHYDKLKEGMRVLAEQMQEFLDKGAGQAVEVASDHGRLERLLEDFESERKKIEHLAEKVGGQTDSVRGYTIQIQLLETGLKQAQEQLKSNSDAIEKLKAKTTQTAQAFNDSTKHNTQTPKPTRTPAGRTILITAILSGALAGTLAAILVTMLT